ncbi:MAG TPA: OmpA family protein [Labilithrix sp.]|nr:OmpA family protein [Labilithrix sp.]
MPEKLSPSSDASLAHVADYLAAKPYVSLLRIEGHSDDGAPAAASAALTERRAMSVAKWLVAHGVDCKRLVAVGFGSTKPVAPSDTPQNNARNSRVEFVNAALRGRPIGGMPVDGGGRVAGDACR